MSYPIIKIKDKYFIWSEISDRPLTKGLTKHQLESFVKDEWGRQGLKDLPLRLKRVEVKGHSTYDLISLEDFLMCNRAGENEKKITIDEIYKKYS